MKGRDLILFDVDGTIAESSQPVSFEIYELFCKLSQKYSLGIVGGSTYAKIIQQLSGLDSIIEHIFSENGCVYHHNNKLQLCANIRENPLYPQINLLIKKALAFLANVDYNLTGQFIDLRNGIIYISLIGIQANLNERNYFINLDKEKGYRKQLLKELQDYATELGISEKISILEGGSVGIGIHPVEYDKVQVLKILETTNNTYNRISYFGDKWLSSGNDYNLINSPSVIGHKIHSVNETMHILKSHYLKE